jgi:hypothetical protein
MSEKKKKDKKKERKIVNTYTINVYDDNSVTVTGAFDNLLYYMDVMNRAERAVLQLIDKQFQEKKGTVIVPTLVGTDGRKLG